MKRPLVLVPACSKEIDGQRYDVAGRKYLQAVAEVAQCLPLVASPAASGDIGALLDAADAILLTGSPSNVAPEHYGEQVPVDAGALDHQRDNLTLPLVRAAVAAATPVFGICRGFQEINVALGGTLEQALHRRDQRIDHREPSELPLPQRYAPRHLVRLSGRLRAWLGAEAVAVNSLHGQGVRRLAGELTAEARAEDDLVEAFQLRDEQRFCLGVQWHPEWRAGENYISIELFRRFGEAARSAL